MRSVRRGLAGLRRVVLGGLLVCLLSGGSDRKVLVHEIWLPPFTKEERIYIAIREAQDAAWTSAADRAIRGPATIRLRDAGELLLPEGFVYVPRVAAIPVLETYGTLVGKPLIGFVTDDVTEHRWIATIRHVPSNVAADDVAGFWTSELLRTLLEAGNRKANQQRETSGVPIRMMVEWAEPPRYDNDTHRLTFTYLTESDRRPEGHGRDLVDTTILFGAKAYLSLDLLTAETRAEQDRPVARRLAAALRFRPDHAYPEADLACTPLENVVIDGLCDLAWDQMMGTYGLFSLAVIQGWWAVAELDLLTREGVPSFGPLRNPRPWPTKKPPASPEGATARP